ncbi:uncharacterized protein LOC106058650 isoform X2 [Biomphalaria glabrata]|uniref:Uncharacterized protein LOC106058650 isoform X2 n=1 Tax=Biomphalaria glabrata TaxID=6526 RepID=A0A9W2ZL00_BIOGL|nr:uncharacterized protein LOC106058650 isoform X2 [Biomphalaria glabrata]
MTFKMSTSETVGVDSNAIYHELSPKIVLTVRVVNALTLLMVLIAVILCFVQGHKNGSYYLLVCNLIISMVVSTFVNWWYRSGDLRTRDQNNCRKANGNVTFDWGLWSMQFSFSRPETDG